MDEDLELLVRQTLRRERITVFGTVATVVFNDAADELARKGRRAIPVIEKAIREEVSAAIGGDDKLRLFREYPGLGNVMVVYFELLLDRRSTDNLPADSLAFLKSLRGQLLLEAIQAIWGVCTCFNPCLAMPANLYDFLVAISEDEASRARQLAGKLIKRYNDLED